MDTANIIIDAIQKVGFPIVACGVLWWSNHKQTEKVLSLLDSTQALIEKLLLKFADEDKENGMDK